MQKKAYKLLAHICEHRQDFLAEHFGDVLEALVTGMPTALSAAKRHRLRCLQVSVLLLLQPEVPGVGGREELSTPEKRQQVHCQQRYNKSVSHPLPCPNNLGVDA